MLYHNYCDANSFEDIKDPDDPNLTLKRHCYYDRNYCHEDVNYIIKILVFKSESGKYHALLPDFIIPYHIYSPMNIFNAINKKFIIYRQLLLYWKNKFDDYLVRFQILFSTNNKQFILDEINNNYYLHYEGFYQLFKLIFFHYLNHQSP